MKKQLYTIITGLLALLIGLSACKKTESYAKQRKAEKAAWEAYVANNGLDLRGTDPATRQADSVYCFSQAAPWPENLYFMTPSGAYLRLEEDDPNATSPQLGNTIILRYKSYDLEGVMFGQNTFEREGMVIVYTPGNGSPSVGLNEALAYLHHGSRAQVLIDSKLGNSTQYNAVVTLRFELTSITVTR